MQINFHEKFFFSIVIFLELVVVESHIAIPFLDYPLGYEMVVL